MNVVLSYGLGVDSTALLLLRLEEPESREFDPAAFAAKVTLKSLNTSLGPSRPPAGCLASIPLSSSSSLTGSARGEGPYDRVGPGRDRLRERSRGFAAHAVQIADPYRCGDAIWEAVEWLRRAELHLSRSPGRWPG